MTEYLKETTKEERDSSLGNRRRRSSDNPQPLDYVTRELVREIVDSKPQAESPPKNFIQKILEAGY